MLNKCMLLVALLMFSCVNVKGVFAYKTYQHETYVRMQNDMEIPSGEPFDWVYRTKGFSGEKMVGIVLQEKQVVWVDLAISRQKIDKITPNVYGTVDVLSPGEYKIVLVSKKKLIDEIRFRVYQPSSDE